MMLELDEVHAHYGKSHVLQGISLRVDGGELVTLLGRNGAGKTTTLKCIAGVVRPSGGRVVFAGREVQGLAPHRIAQRGVCLVPEHRGIFRLLTVEENLLLGQRKSSPWQLADRHSIIEQGAIVYDDATAAFIADDAVKDRYLGVGLADAEGEDA
jgi:branched-chain amino acid transport system ATP-binding protein